MNTLSTTDRLTISLRLRELDDLRGRLAESLIDAEKPRELLANVDALHTQSAGLLAFVVGLAREPGEYSFVGANVQLPEERTAEEDRAAQRFIERRAG